MNAGPAPTANALTARATEPVYVCVRAHGSTISGMSAKMDGWSSPLCSPRQPMLWPGLACCMAAAPSPAWGTLLWADALKPCDVLAGANTNPSKAMVHRHTCTHACTHTQPTHTQKCTHISNCTCMYLHMHPQMPTSWLHMHARKLVAQTRVAHCQPDCVELVHTLAGNHAQAHGCNDNNLQSN